MQQELNEAYGMRNKVQGLLDDGVLKADNQGQLHAVDDPLERESLRMQSAQASKQRGVQNNPPNLDLAVDQLLQQNQDDGEFEDM